MAAKQKENQPDKLEKIKRFEKEKKVLQKKEEGASRISVKPKLKPQKRTKNWTKVYQDGLYGDEEDELGYDYDFK